MWRISLYILLLLLIIYIRDIKCLISNPCISYTVVLLISYDNIIRQTISIRSMKSSEYTTLIHLFSIFLPLFGRIGLTAIILHFHPLCLFLPLFPHLSSPFISLHHHTSSRLTCCKVIILKTRFVEIRYLEFVTPSVTTSTVTYCKWRSAFAMTSALMLWGSDPNCQFLIDSHQAAWVYMCT